MKEKTIVWAGLRDCPPHCSYSYSNIETKFAWLPVRSCGRKNDLIWLKSYVQVIVTATTPSCTVGWKWREIYSEDEFTVVMLTRKI